MNRPDPEELVDRARVVALPMRERFRGIDVREALLIEGEGGRWAEWSPFTEYGDAEAATWLAAALEAASAVPERATRDEGRRPERAQRVEGRRPERAQRDEGRRPERATRVEGRRIRVNATVPAVPAAAVPAVLARFPGCRTAKVKVAQPGQSLDDDVARVAAVRAALGSAGRVRVDANGAWTLDEATTALLALAAFGLEYAEQPVAGIRDLAALRERLDGAVRIAADESVRKPSDPLEVARAGAADLLVLKCQPLGGASRALAIAAEAGLPVVSSSALETSVGLAAALRFAAALEDTGMTSLGAGHELDHGLGTAALLAADVTGDPLLPVDGAIAIREVAPDPELLDRCAAAPERRAWWLARLRRCATLAYSPE